MEWGCQGLALAAAAFEGWGEGSTLEALLPRPLFSQSTSGSGQVVACAPGVHTTLTPMPACCLQSANALLCGRILLFLAKFLSLTERSGVNLHGVCNTENTTPVEDVQEVGCSRLAVASIHHRTLCAVAFGPALRGHVLTA